MYARKQHKRLKSLQNSGMISGIIGRKILLRKILLNLNQKDLKFYQNLLFAIHNASNRTGISTDFGMVYSIPRWWYCRSRPGYHAIFSSDGKLKKGLLSDHEVLVAAFAASMDVKILRKGVKLSGTPEQMAQLQRGIEAVNEILPEGKKLVITNPVDAKILAKFKPLDFSHTSS